MKKKSHLTFPKSTSFHHHFHSAIITIFVWVILFNVGSNEDTINYNILTAYLITSWNNKQKKRTNFFSFLFHFWPLKLFLSFFHPPSFLSLIQFHFISHSLWNKREIKLFFLYLVWEKMEKFQLPIEERIMEVEDEMPEKEVVCLKWGI